MSPLTSWATKTIDFEAIKAELREELEKNLEPDIPRGYITWRHVSTLYVCMFYIILHVKQCNIVINFVGNDQGRGGVWYLKPIKAITDSW